MYEHAYAMELRAAVRPRDYIEAFFKNVQWGGSGAAAWGGPQEGLDAALRG